MVCQAEGPEETNPGARRGEQEVVRKRVGAKTDLSGEERVVLWQPVIPDEQ